MSAPVDPDLAAQLAVEGREPADVPEIPIREPIVIEEDEDGWPKMPDFLIRRS